MHTLYHQYLASLASVLNISLPPTPFNCLQVKFDNRACVMRSINDGNDIFVECQLVVPENMDLMLRNRAAMQANYCFFQSRGATLALDNDNRLILQRQFNLEDIGTEQFLHRMETFLNTATQLDEAFASFASDNKIELTQFAMRV